MNEKFFNRENVEYFWEYQYPFAEYFLKEIFKDNFKRKYSVGGEGICNLIKLNSKLYDVDLKEARKMLENDGKKAFRDADKDAIIISIAQELNKNNIEYTINSGKFITFKLGNHIAKLEVIRKMREPD